MDGYCVQMRSRRHKQQHAHFTADISTRLSGTTVTNNINSGSAVLGIDKEPARSMAGTLKLQQLERFQPSLILLLAPSGPTAAVDRQSQKSVNLRLMRLNCEQKLTEMCVLRNHRFV